MVLRTLQKTSGLRIRRALLCLAVALPAFAGCQSTLSRDTNRIREEYDAELARLEAQYREDLAHCDSTPNPAVCKEQVSEAYRERLELTWDLEQAEFEQVLYTALHARPRTSPN